MSIGWFLFLPYAIAVTVLINIYRQHYKKKKKDERENFETLVWLVHRELFEVLEDAKTRNNLTLEELEALRERCSILNQMVRERRIRGYQHLDIGWLSVSIAQRRSRRLD